VPELWAGGPFVGDTGSQSFQRSGAFVAKANDPSALVFNPAGLAKVKRKQLQLGANVVDLSLEFERFGTDAAGMPYQNVSHQGAPSPIPYVGFAMPLNKKIGLGIGLYTPHGYTGRSFPQVDASGSEDLNTPQRYDIVSAKAIGATVSGGLSYQLNEKWAVGARLSWTAIKQDSTRVLQGLANGQEDPGNDAVTTVSVADYFAPSVGVGVHYTHSPSVEFGASWSSQTNLNLEGETKTQLGTTLQAALSALGADANANLSLPPGEAPCPAAGSPDAPGVCVATQLPMSAAVGVRVIARDSSGEEVGDLELDVRWENWKAASDAVVTSNLKNFLSGGALDPTTLSRGFQDTYSIRLGSSAKIKAFERPVEIRAGVGYESAAAPRSWTRLDTDGTEKFMGTLGAGIGFGRYRLDAGFGVAASPTRQVREERPADQAAQDRNQPDVPVALGETPYNPFNNGQFQTRYLIGSLSVTTWF